MDFASPHIGFVVVAYGISAAALLALIAVVVSHDRAAQAKLQNDD